MKSLILFLLFTFSILPPNLPCYLYLMNLSEKNKFEVYVSEDENIIFSGIVYPKKPIIIEMERGKLYGIKVKRITTKLEPTTIIPEPKSPDLIAKITKIKDIEYYRCIGHHFEYRFGVKTDIP